MEKLPQSATIRVALKAYLSSDHISVATAKTIAVVISKNGGAFANPSAGATNATEIANGWYYVDLSTTDTNTLGPLIVRGTSTGVDDVEPPPFNVVSAHNAGFDAMPNLTAGASGGLPLAVDASGRVDVLKVNGTSQTARDIGLNVDAAISSIPTANGNADALLDRAAGVETSWTVRQAMRIMLSALGGKLAGAATTTVTVRDMGDVKNRISATVDANGNRTAVTLDAT